MFKKLLPVFLMAVLVANVAFAHPPADVATQYNPSKKELHVTVIHPVPDTTKHYIKAIKVIKDGNTIKEESFSEQNNRMTQPVVLVLDGVKPGDKITVEAECNINGVGVKHLDL